MRTVARVVLAEAKLGLQQQFQYRAAAFFSILGFMIEPIVYLVVWRTVAESSASTVGGYTADDFVAYYIVWTLVRNMNLALTPYTWDHWIQRGRISDRLLEPANLFARVTGRFAGDKIVWILAWFPIAAFMTLVFRPQLSPSILQVTVFFVAIWGAFLVRQAVLYLMGLISFWTTRASALFETMVAVELIASGRLVPLSVMPDWVERAAAWMPFKWTFQYPIEVFIGKLDTAAMLQGLGYQAGWSVALIITIAVVWSRATRRYTAAGA